VLLLNECLLLLFISLSTQSGNFWIRPRIKDLSHDVNILPNHKIFKVYGGIVVKFHAFLTSEIGRK
jgi:hypothetical protein